MSMSYKQKNTYTPRYTRTVPFKRVPIRGAYFTSLTSGRYVKISRTQRGNLNPMLSPRNPYRCLATGKVIYYSSVVNESANTICYTAGANVSLIMNLYAVPSNLPCVVVDHPSDE